MASVQPNLHPDPSAIRLKASAVAVRLALDASAAQWRVAASAVRLSPGDVALDKGGFVLQRDAASASDSPALTAYPRWSEQVTAADGLSYYFLRLLSASDTVSATDAASTSFVSFLGGVDTATATESARLAAYVVRAEAAASQETGYRAVTNVEVDAASAADAQVLSTANVEVDAASATDAQVVASLPPPVVDAASGADTVRTGATKSLADSTGAAVDGTWYVWMAGSVINEFEFNGGLV